VKFKTSKGNFVVRGQVILRRHIIYMIRHIFIFAIFFLFTVFMSLLTANAQGAISYRAFEVVDSYGSPVAGVKVETLGFGCRMVLETEQNGRLKDGLPVCYGDFTTTGFKISKPGYFPFEDLGMLWGPFRDETRQAIKIELLVIPKTDAERKLVGAEQSKRELMQAAKSGNSAAVVKLLKSGINPNLTTDDLRGVPGPRNVPAIVFAAMSGDGRTVTDLLSAGADVRGGDKAVRDVLFYYLEAYRFSGVYKESAEKDEYDKSYQSGLENLVKAEADLRGTNDRGETALMVAVRQRSVGAVRALLKQGAPVNAKDTSGKTALTYAQERRLTPDGNDNVVQEIIKLLVASGAQQF
jgi:hypothetical protein